MNLLSFLPWCSLPAARAGRKRLADDELPCEAEERTSGCGWFDSSHDLHSGLMVQEHASVDAVPNELPLAFWLGRQVAAPAIVGSMQGRSEGAVTREQALDGLSEHLEQLGPRAHALGVPLLFEPLNRYETNLVNSVADGLELLKPLRTKNVKLLVDLFHANIEEASIAESLHRAAGAVGHVHFADSNRRAAGLGHMDFTPIAEALRGINYNGYASAEILPLPDSDTAAKQTIASFRKWFRPD